jgi:hypothetical protein
MSNSNGFQFGLRAIFVLTGVAALLSWAAVTFPVGLALVVFWLVWCVFAGAFVAVSMIVIEAILGIIARVLRGPSRPDAFPEEDTDPCPAVLTRSQRPG